MDESAQGRSLRNIFSRQSDALQISTYQVGDVNSTQVVEISPEATLVGHIVAPIVHVYGLVYGSILAKETAVYPGGQVWGDVYTAKLSIEPNGSIQGWTSTIESTAFEQHAKNLTLPQSDPPELPGDTQIAAPDVQELDLKKTLQQSAALALAARAEMEESFDKRLQAMAGKIKERNETLNADLETAVSELSTLRSHYEKAQDSLATRSTQQNEMVQEIQIARSLLTERETEIVALQDNSESDQIEIIGLREKQQMIEAALKTDKKEHAALQKRYENLETALQASLEHTGELEESLLRWQELAEYAESRAKEIENMQISLQSKFEVAQAAQAKLEEDHLQLKGDLKSAQATIDKQQRLIKQLEGVTK